MFISFAIMVEHSSTCNMTCMCIGAQQRERVFVHADSFSWL